MYLRVPLKVSLANFGVLTGKSNLMVDGSNAAQSISDEIFNNTRSVTESHIRLRPFTEVIIREFVQWTRDTIRLDNDPVSVYFKVNKRNNLIGI